MRDSGPRGPQNQKSFTDTCRFALPSSSSRLWFLSGPLAQTLGGVSRTIRRRFPAKQAGRPGLRPDSLLGHKAPKGEPGIPLLEHRIPRGPNVGSPKVYCCAPTSHRMYRSVSPPPVPPGGAPKSDAWVFIGYSFGVPFREPAPVPPGGAPKSDAWVFIGYSFGATFVSIDEYFWDHPETFELIDEYF